MKLIRAIAWYLKRSYTDPKYSYALRQATSLALCLLVAFIVLLYFFVQGFLINETKQIWGCGLGLAIVSLPLATMINYVLGAFDERSK